MASLSTIAQPVLLTTPSQRGLDRTLHRANRRRLITFELAFSLVAFKAMVVYSVAPCSLMLPPPNAGVWVGALRARAGAGAISAKLLLLLRRFAPRSQRG